MLQERKGGQSVKPGTAWPHVKIIDNATTYDGGGGDDSRLCDFKAGGLDLAVRAAVPVSEAN